MLLVSFPGQAHLCLGGCGKCKEETEGHLRHRKLIGEAIRRYRKQADLTQEALAESADHPEYLGEIERGEKIISIEALLRMAKAIEVFPREI